MTYFNMIDKLSNFQYKNKNKTIIEETNFNPNPNPYCDTEKLKKKLLTTKPFSCNLYPHEIYLIVYILCLKPLITSVSDRNRIRPYYVKSNEKFIQNMINRGYVKIITDENQINRIHINDLRKILKINKIKCPSTKSDTIQIIKNNFSANEIINFFNSGYYDVTKKGIEALKKAQEEIYVNIKNSVNLSNFRFDLQKVLNEDCANDHFKIYNYNVFQYYVNFDIISSKCNYGEYLSPDFKIIEISNTLDCRIDDDFITNYYYSETESFFSNYFDKITPMFYGANPKEITKINFYYKNKFIVSFDNVIRISNIRHSKLLLLFLNQLTENIVLFDIINNKIIISITCKSDELYKYINPETNNDIPQIEYYNNCILNNSNKKYAFIISVNDEITNNIIKFLSKEIKIISINNIFSEDTCKNYIIDIDEKNQYFELIIYMISKNILGEPLILGKNLMSFNHILHLVAPNNMIKSLILDETLRNYNYDKDKLSIIKYLINNKQWNYKANLVNKIEKEFYLFKYADYRTQNYKGSSFYQIKTDIYINEKKYSIIYNKFIEKMKIKGIIPVKWKNEFELYLITKKYFPSTIFQYRAKWLDKQSIDIFIPDYNVGIEYQGIQHYEVVNIFGGKKELTDRIKRDKLKKKLCIENNIKLIEWKYDIAVNEIEFKKILKEIENNKK